MKRLFGGEAYRLTGYGIRANPTASPNKATSVNAKFSQFTCHKLTQNYTVCFGITLSAQSLLSVHFIAIIQKILNNQIPISANSKLNKRLNLSA
jgi:hypothetical protein